MKSLTDQESRFIEAYAAALQDILWQITGDNGCSKNYDPMTIEDGRIMHSYAFDMKDGGRHHPVSDYKDVHEIKSILLDEVANHIRNETHDLLSSVRKLVGEWRNESRKEGGSVVDRMERDVYRKCADQLESLLAQHPEASPNPAPEG